MSSAEDLLNMANLVDPRADSYLPPDRALLAIEYDEGKEVGESCGISELDKIFTMKRGFLNCIAGWGNAGKTTMMFFITLMRSIKYKTKWNLWSPEMLNSIKRDGRVYITANEIYDELAHMYSGKPSNKLKVQFDEYMAIMDFIDQYFFTMNPSNKKYDNITDHCMYYYEYFGCDGFVIDSFKDLILDEKGTTDKVYRKAFSEFKEVAMKTHGFVYLIAHPKATNEMKERPKTFSKTDNTPYKVVTPNLLLGGSAWDTDMDQICSIYRQNAHIDPNDPWTTFINLKQKKQNLTNRKGEYSNIEFDFSENRFYFNGICPIDGKLKENVQTEIPYDRSAWRNTKSKNKNPTTNMNGFEKVVPEDEIGF